MIIPGGELVDKIILFFQICPQCRDLNFRSWRSAQVSRPQSAAPSVQIIDFSDEFFDFRNLRFSDFEILGFWDFEILGFWDFRIFWRLDSD